MSQAFAARATVRRGVRRVGRALPVPVRRRLKSLLGGGRLGAALVDAARPAGAPGTGAPRSTQYIPRDHARQVGSRYYIEEALTGDAPPSVVVDLGCGNGSSAEIFRRFRPDVTWIGVDIEESASAKAIVGEQVHLYDGIHLPFPDGSIPLIYTNQVFEHVRHPEPLLAEIARVLTPGGVFIGSVSQLEPYHSFSVVGGYTLYGWSTLCHTAGLVLEEARPSIDALSLINRQYQGAPPETAAWWQLSPLNVEIDAWAESTGASAFDTNARKLQFCGQFAFRVRRPSTGAAPASLAAASSAASGVSAATASPGRMTAARRAAARVLLKAGLALSR